MENRQSPYACSEAMPILRRFALLSARELTMVSEECRHHLARLKTTSNFCLTTTWS